MKLVLDNICKRFGQQLVLDSVSASLDTVHTLVLIGPSGGGKSTLLRILAGLIPPDSGCLTIDNEPVLFQEPSLRNHRRQIGTVFQAFNLFPHLSALRNITLPLIQVHGLSESDADERAHEILKRFQLEDHSRKHPAALSGGQRQRVAIARAIAIRPRLLLFDEPTSALDPEMTAEVLEMIQELRHEGRDFVLVTHQMGFARGIADQVGFLANGRIAELGSVEQVFNRPTSRECADFLTRVLKY